MLFCSNHSCFSECKILLVEGSCSCTVVEISTGVRALNKGEVWLLDFLAEGPDSLPEFQK